MAQVSDNIKALGSGTNVCFFTFLGGMGIVNFVKLFSYTRSGVMCISITMPMLDYNSGNYQDIIET